MTTKTVLKVNRIYNTVSKNLFELRRMFKNHKAITDTIQLSEKILLHAFGLIGGKTEEIEVRRQFNKIIKIIK